ncbi:MAG: glycosyltransferase [Planctomycetes bacterium]|nr:glycosyltransferase [Planctomycetota bacterium]
MVPQPLGILVVAFHFPPLSAAGTHRTSNFVRELARRGHRVGVVTTSGGDFKVDASLTAKIPAGVDVVRAPHVDPFALLARWRGNGAATATGANGPGSAASAPKRTVDRALDYVSRLFDVPDRYASWIVPALLRGIAVARRVRADVLYTTAPPFSAHVVGLALHRVLDLPWIVDLRDPWATNPFNVRPFASLRAIDEALEAAVVKRAHTVVLNTELAEAGYRARYPDQSNFTTITNGIDPDLLERAAPTVVRNGKRSLLHAGTIYGRRSPHALLEALRRFRVESPQLARELRIVQLGGVENAPALLERARSLGVADAFEIRPAVGHAEAFECLQRADGLLLLGVSGERPEVQVPAKLFEYLAARRPMVVLAKSGGAIARTLAQADVHCLLADPDDPNSVLAALRSFAAPDATADVETSGIGAFRYENLATRLEATMLSACGADE